MKRTAHRLLPLVALTAFVFIFGPGCQKAEDAALPETHWLIAGADGHGKTTLLAAMTRNLAAGGRGSERSYDDLAAAGAADGATVGWKAGGQRIVLTDLANHTDIVTRLGASPPVDGVILLVAQAEGLREQTREQIAAAGTAAVGSVIVFQSKGDLVDDEELKDLEQSEIEQALVEAGLLAEGDAGTWEGGTFQPGTALVFRGSAQEALAGDAAAMATIGALVEALDDAAASD